MSAKSAESCEPDLTPMLDMVFQLVTFFMLVINFKGASMDLSLKLPVLGSARPIDWRGEREPLVLNISNDGEVTAYGEKKANIEAFINQEVRLMKQYLQAQGDSNPDEMPIPVIVRADQKAPFHHVNRIIKLCQNNGFRQFQLSAMSRQEN